MHYTLQQLEEYCRAGLTEIERIHIEEHIYGCAACMNEFLLAAETAGMAVYPHPSKEFSKRLLLKLYSKKKDKYKTAPLIKNNVVLCYLIAACITLFIMWNGTMDEMIQSVPSLLQQTESGWQLGGFWQTP